MEFLNLYTIHKDDRGIFQGITNKYTWGEINFIETRQNIIRGKHYHKYTKELFYILEGRIEISVFNLVTKERHDFTAGPNDVFIIDPYEVHTFKTLEPSKWLNMLSHKLDDEHPDIFKSDADLAS